MLATLALLTFQAISPQAVSACTDHGDVDGDGYFTIYVTMPKMESCYEEPNTGDGNLYGNASPGTLASIGWLRGPTWILSEDAAIDCEVEGFQRTGIVWVVQDPAAPMGCAHIEARTNAKGKYKLDRGPARSVWNAEVRVQSKIFERHPKTGLREVASIVRFDASVSDSGKVSMEFGGIGGALDGMSGSFKLGMHGNSGLVQLGDIPPIEDEGEASKCTRGITITQKIRGYSSLAAGWNSPRVGRITLFNVSGGSEFEFDSYGPCL